MIDLCRSRAEQNIYIKLTEYQTRRAVVIGFGDMKKPAHLAGLLVGRWLKRDVIEHPCFTAVFDHLWWRHGIG